MRMKYWLTVIGILLLGALLCGAGTAAPTVSAEGLSKNAEVLLLAPYNNTQLFVYTDTAAEIRLLDGSAAYTTAYPADRAFLHGDSVSAVAPMADYLVIERFSLHSLSRTDFYTAEIPEKDLKYLEMDAAARAYAVRFSAPTALFLYDAAGSDAGRLELGEEILGLQMLDDRLYVFFRTQVLCFLPGDTPVQTERFTCPADASARSMVTADVYLNANGDLCRKDGTVLPRSRSAAGRSVCMAAEHGYFYWSDGSDTVLRYHLSAETLEKCTLSGTPEALTGSGAVIRHADTYIFTPYGSFTEILPEPTPAPTHEAGPSADPSSLEIAFLDGFLQVPAGTTAAQLKSVFPDRILTVEAKGRAAAGKVRTGWTVLLDGTPYTAVVPGDVNGSGTVNRADLRLLQSMLAGPDMPAPEQQCAADLNRDGTLSAADLVLLTRQLE